MDTPYRGTVAKRAGLGPVRLAYRKQYPPERILCLILNVSRNAPNKARFVSSAPTQKALELKKFHAPTYS
jgi:hypothetical protein